VLQNLFGAYLVLAIGYNLVSLVLISKTGKGAAPTDPLTGILMISVLFLTQAAAGQVAGWMYLFFLSTFTGLIFCYGVLGHLLHYDRDKYFSRVTWFSAFGINLFGVAVLSTIIVRAF